MARLSLLLLVLLLMGTSPTWAQDTNPAAGGDTESAPPGSTVITSDELRADQIAHTSIFSGNVTVVGTNFSMTCREMTVNFTKDGKIDNIIATGDVVINQPGRVTKCGRAQYFQDEDKFVLTDQPIIVDNKNQITAPKIIIYRTQKTIQTEGRSRVTLPEGSGATSAPAGSP
jgi:lipopolysaccharide transport protein LptA